MNRRKFLVTSVAFVGGVVLTYGTAWANKAESRLEVPESAAKGSEATIKMTVIHSANSSFHLVEWAWIVLFQTDQEKKGVSLRRP